MGEAHRIAEWCAGKPLRPTGPWRVPCPAHGGTDNNLVIKVGHTRTLWKCFSGDCTPQQIREAIPSYLWDADAYISSRDTVDRQPKPLTLRAKDDSKTFPFAEDMWMTGKCVDETDHAYAVLKGFNPSAHCRLNTLPHDFGPLSKGDRVLVLQMQCEHGTFTGTQLINEKGKKAFAGCAGMLVLSNDWWTPETRFHICEGYATAFACHHVFPGGTPICAFSKSAMPKVESVFRSRIRQERGFDPVIVVHHEPASGLDVWDRWKAGTSDEYARKVMEALCPSTK